MSVSGVASPQRRGFVRRSDIPQELLSDLNRGLEEALTLAEWLAIDLPHLLQAVLPAAGCPPESIAEATALARQLHQEPVRRRLLAVGSTLFRALKDLPQGTAVFAHLAAHGSSMARAWAVYMLRADRTLDLAGRLAATRPIVEDRSTEVRECACECLRPYLAAELPLALDLLEAWVVSPQESLRRCAVEALRPRGARGASPLKALTSDPEPALPLLERLRSDPSRYVQVSVANWLQDASRSRPDWVMEVCERWQRESPSRETAWTVGRALCAVRNGHGAG